MFFAVVTLITALGMASIAAWFAIAGIMALFAGAAIPALIMGSVVELGKIVGVSWIYRHWKEKTSLKYIMIPFVTIAVLLTSMGIFGFLSKAHIEQNAPVGNNVAKIERLDQRITRENAKITDADIIIGQLDDQVQVLIDYNKISDPVNGSRAVRARQQEQRDALSGTITEAQDNIDTYEDEKVTLNSELRALEIEVGPVKYIAEMIYEDPKSNLDRAVRFVIIAFIFVFDPMAILLLMGANFSLMGIRGRSGPKDPTPTPPSTKFSVPVQEEIPEEAYENEEEIKLEIEENPGESLIKLIDDAPISVKKYSEPELKLELEPEPVPEEPEPGPEPVPEEPEPGPELKLELEPEPELSEPEEPVVLSEPEEPVVPESKKLEAPEEPAKPLNIKKDRNWLNSFPRDDASVTEDLLKTTLQELNNRDLTKDEKSLMSRLQRIASRRNIPWSIAKRSFVTTNNPILKR